MYKINFARLILKITSKDSFVLFVYSFFFVEKNVLHISFFVVLLTLQINKK